MMIINSIDKLRDILDAQRANHKTIGLVPTMGFLHQGHLSLMQCAKRDTDFVVVSIFVNPTQFGPNEDFEAYPRDLKRDAERCDSVGVDVIFAPEVSEMYPEQASTFVSCEGAITRTLCGASRPGHFKGVTTVVAKLFNIVQPDKAFFGQKDAQQVVIIEKMVRELNMRLQIVPCPIVREADGLAMSSRNTYLSETARKEAPVLSQSLAEANRLIQSGERDSEAIINVMRKTIETAPSAQIDYIQIVDGRNLEDLKTLKGEVLIALAVKIDQTRLIDNLRLTLPA